MSLYKNLTGHIVNLIKIMRTNYYLRCLYAYRQKNKKNVKKGGHGVFKLAEDQILLVIEK